MHVEMHQGIPATSATPISSNRQYILKLFSFQIFWLRLSVPDEGYSGSTPCALILISTFSILLLRRQLFGVTTEIYNLYYKHIKRQSIRLNWRQYHTQTIICRHIEYKIINTFLSVFSSIDILFAQLLLSGLVCRL